MAEKDLLFGESIKKVADREPIGVDVDDLRSGPRFKGLPGRDPEEVTWRVKEDDPGEPSTMSEPVDSINDEATFTPGNNQADRQQDMSEVNVSDIYDRPIAYGEKVAAETQSNPDDRMADLEKFLKKRIDFNTVSDKAQVLVLHFIGFIPKPINIPDDVYKAAMEAFSNNRGKVEQEEEAVAKVLSDFGILQKAAMKLMKKAIKVVKRLKYEDAVAWLTSIPAMQEALDSGLELWIEYTEDGHVKMDSATELQGQTVVIGSTDYLIGGSN